MKINQHEPNVILFHDFSDNDAYDLINIIKNGIINQRRTGVNTCPAKIKIVFSTFNGIFTLVEYLPDIFGLLKNSQANGKNKIPKLILYTNSNRKDLNLSIRALLWEYEGLFKLVGGRQFHALTPIHDALVDVLIETVCLWKDGRLNINELDNVITSTITQMILDMERKRMIHKRPVEFSARSVICPDVGRLPEKISIPIPKFIIHDNKNGGIILIDISQQRIETIKSIIKNGPIGTIFDSEYPLKNISTIKIVLTRYNDLSDIISFMHMIDNIKEEYKLTKMPSVLLCVALTKEYIRDHYLLGTPSISKYAAVCSYINMLNAILKNYHCDIIIGNQVSNSIFIKISDDDKLYIDKADESDIGRIIYKSDMKVLEMIKLALNTFSKSTFPFGYNLPRKSAKIALQNDRDESPCSLKGDEPHTIGLHPTHIVEPRQCEFDGDILNVIKLDDDGTRNEKKKQCNIEYGEAASRYIESNALTDEERIIHDAILAARKTEEFLWGEYNGKWDIEEWRRMFRKRIHKIDEIDVSRPHAKIELKKRLLQNAALSIALLNIIDNADLPEKCDVPSNLPEYKNGVIFSLINTSNAYIATIHLTENDGCDINEIIGLLINNRLSLLVNGNDYDVSNIDIIDSHTLRIKGLEKFNKVYTVELRCKEADGIEDAMELFWIKDSWNRNGAIGMPSVLYLLDQISFDGFTGSSIDWLLIKPIFDAIFKGDKSEMISCIKEIMSPHKINFFIDTCTKLYEKING